MQSRFTPDGSIDALFTTLEGWLGAVLPETTPEHLPLNGTAPAEGIALRTIGIAIPTRRANPALPHLRCDVLVTLTSADPRQEAAAFARLLLAAAARPDVTVLDAPTALQLCATLGIQPALGCVLRVAALLPDPDEPPVQRVRFPLRAEIGEIGVIGGVVLGPGDVPIAGVEISAEGFPWSVRTDRAGRFQLCGVAIGAPTLTARGRGAETIVAAAEADKRITIHLPLEV